jgi:uncharacterized protein with PIN domain
MIKRYLTGQNASSDKPHSDYSKDNIAQIQKSLDRQMLIIEAMWTLMKEKGYTDEELQSVISKLDIPNMRKAENADLKDLQRCPNCGVPLQKTDRLITRCIYCGHEMIGNPFDTK